MGTGDILLGGKPCHGLASPPGGGGGGVAILLGLLRATETGTWEAPAVWAFNSCAPLPYLTITLMPIKIITRSLKQQSRWCQ